MKLKTLALLASIFSLLAAISGMGNSIYQYFQVEYFTLVWLLTQSPYWLMNLPSLPFSLRFIETSNRSQHDRQ